MFHLERVYSSSQKLFTKTGESDVGEKIVNVGGQNWSDKIIKLMQTSIFMCYLQGLI